MLEFTVGIILGVALGLAVVYLLSVRRDPPTVHVRACANCRRIRPDLTTVRGVAVCGDCR